LLNAYFDAMCPILKGGGGDIDQSIGDAIMAVFGDIRGRDPAPARAVRAALAMQAAMPAFNEGREPKLRMRIGINTGPLIRGDLGSRVVRRDYTVIGDTVNRANRYESKCPVGGVMISQSTRDALGDALDAGAVDFVTKPAGEVSADLSKVQDELVRKLTAAAGSKPRPPAPAPAAAVGAAAGAAGKARPVGAIPAPPSSRSAVPSSSR